jgi:hypothetical protein
MAENTSIPRCETIADWQQALGYKGPRMVQRMMAEGKLPPRVPSVGKVIWPPGSIAKFLNGVLNQQKP